MATTRATLGPLSAEMPSSAYPELKKVNDRFVLAFDAASAESVYWTFIAPQGLTTPVALVVHGFMASATTGNLLLAAQLEAVTPTDTLDLDSTTSFDTANTSAATAVPGTAGYPFAVSLTLTNNDSIAAGDVVRLSFRREAADAADTAAGDWYCTACELRDSA